MKTHFLAAMLLAATSSVAMAQNATEKAMKDHPGHVGAGKTDMPTAKPNSGSLSEKAMQDQPGVNSDKTGNTAMPTAKAEDGSLSTKVMKDK
jgi:hypothetical protein